MGNSTVKSHQATEVRLKSRRKVNRPLRPIPSRAIEAGSGTTGCGSRREKALVDNRDSAHWRCLDRR